MASDLLGARSLTSTILKPNPYVCDSDGLARDVLERPVGACPQRLLRIVESAPPTVNVLVLFIGTPP
ncbi:hypothetical protein acdb102_23070 [Acidothermaceae bacterium B102]|nr:hypothetical protein acdb102_23070 [Acidothermaceae bacterium B102]